MISSSLIVLAFLGDLMLGRGVSDRIALDTPEQFWGTTLPFLQSTDAVFANLECAITSHKSTWTKTSKVFHFRARPEATHVLKVANVRVVNLANNHTLDFEEKGLLDTIKYLDQAGIKHAGAGSTLSKAREPVILPIKGLNVGFISATDNEPPFAAEEDKPGTHYLKINTKPETLSHLQEDIKKAKSAGADFIILSLHWGPNWVIVPSKVFQGFAHKAIEMGVNVIHGHSDHIFQGIEFYKDGVIFYSTGDFLDDYAIDPELHNDWSFIFMLELDGKKISKVKAAPVSLTYTRVNLAEGKTATQIMARMEELCHYFGTATKVVGNILEFSKE
jgi:poly-gamma-glutamate synthesis protein (capsule biosynthesis protein)